MEKKQIEEAYQIAEDYVKTFYRARGQSNMEKDVVQIGIQMALNNGEVLFNEDGTVKRIE